MLDARSPTRAGQALSVLVTAAGGSLFVWGGLAWTGEAGRLPAAAPLLIGLAVGAGLFAGRPGAGPTVLADAFLFAGVLLFGTPAAVVAAGSEGLVSGWLATKRPVAAVASLARRCLPIFAGGSLYAMLLGPPVQSGAPAALAPRNIGALAVMLAAHRVLESLIARRPSPAGVTAPAGAAPAPPSGSPVDPLFSSAAAGIAALLFQALGTVALFASVPALALAHATHRSVVTRLRRRLHAAERANERHLLALEALALAIDARGQTSPGHPCRVRAYATGLARHAGLHGDELEAVSLGALLHDVGRLGVPDHILNKRGELSAAEHIKLRTYPVLGAEILEAAGFPEPVPPIIRHHREHWDGSGSPDRLAGERIPVGARIVAIADAFDAMVQPRPYRRPLTVEEALADLRRDAGRRFDPALVELFSAHVEELHAEAVTCSRQLARFEPVAPSGDDVENVTGEVTTAGHPLERIAAAPREALAMHEFTRDLGRSLGLDQTLERILGRLRGLIRCDCAIIYLWDGEAGALRVAAADGEAAVDLRDHRLGPGEGITGWAIENQRTLINVSPAADFPDERAASARRFHSALVTPMLRDGRPIGAIALYRESEGEFTSEDERILETIAPEAAAAIENARTFESTRESAMTDSLTGLPNLRFLFAQLEKEAVRARRHRRPFGIAVFDLDRFKPINDRYGHRAGDAVLRAVGRYLAQQLRTGDTVCRWGGDEFVALLPDAEPALIRSVVERMQRGIEALEIDCGGPEPIRVGVSVGWAAYPDDADDIEELIRIADKRMYANKAARHSAPVS